jgi:hypothetical protein
LIRWCGFSTPSPDGGARYNLVHGLGVGIKSRHKLNNMHLKLKIDQPRRKEGHEEKIPIYFYCYIDKLIFFVVHNKLTKTRTMKIIRSFSAGVRPNQNFINKKKPFGISTKGLESQDSKF